MRPLVAILAAVAAVAVLAAGAGRADAGRKKARPKPPKEVPVRVETTPDDATVFVGDKESGPAGRTPLDLELAPGEYVLIIEHEGRVPLFESVEVEARSVSEPQVFSFFLEPSTGTLVVEGDDLPEGARVLVDGNEVGTVPVRAPVEAGPHQVQVVVDGRDPYEEWIEVAGGEEHVMSVAAASLPTPEVEVEAPRPRPATGAPLGAAHAALQVGWRRFTYDAPRTANLRAFSGSNSVWLGIDVELHPWRRYVRNRFLDHLAVVGAAGLAPAITATDPMGTAVNAYWRSQAAGLRFRADVVPSLAFDIDAGWEHLLYTFRDQNDALVLEVPDVDYHMVRLGARAVVRAGRAEAWLGADNLIVVSAGALADRFRGAKVDGVGGRAGVSLWLWKRYLQARLEGSVSHLGWTFTSEPGDAYDADGGVDDYYGVQLGVGGSY
ncbi:MAG: PEGA domain-containing protein [Kofleriaceae bacterium]|nr:PEGA domain-containing protein [Myxococcales bacterium]MCB9563390.1 PEGA domain-containing protein [Kofleriaceae bacterium]MCB9573682.1 PEGA domain-containing protein [Kofleriaceae bacterium]